MKKGRQILLFEVLAKTNLVKSKSDAKRKISEGVYLNGEKFNNPFAPVEDLFGDKDKIRLSLHRHRNIIEIVK